MTAWIDAHNHLQDPRLGDPEDVIRTMRQAGVIRCVVNATREADWAAVEKLHLDHPDFVLPAFGIHPWQAHTATEGWQDRLTRLLEKHACSSVGECGLDGWLESPSFEIQTPVFLDQLGIARKLDRPATIHCLKAWEPLFDAFNDQPPPRRFLMHSFGGSIEIAKRLIPLGAWFSFSGYFLQPRKRKVLEIYRKLPHDRLLVETDAPDMLPPENLIAHPLQENSNHPANLASIAMAFAEALDIPTEGLASLTRENFGRCFL